MFTGLVEDTGAVVRVSPEGRGRRLAFRTAIPLVEVAIGDSIAVNGVCLTVESWRGDVWEAVAGQETLALTTLGGLGIGDRVHLERALRLGDRVGGHLVAGHVDGVGRVISSAASAESWILWLDVGADLARYVATKGSICLDGVSLTVNEVHGERVRLNLVPHTAAVTRLGALRAGDAVNIEVDLIARYVERLLQRDGSSGLSMETLQRNGFI